MPTTSGLLHNSPTEEMLPEVPVAMNFDEILSNLIVGSCPRDRSDIEWLKRNLGITAVLSLQTDHDLAQWDIDWEAMESAYQTSGLQIRRVPVKDFNANDLERKLPACVKTLDELLRADHTVYVHCTAGMNRSPSAVVAYLHRVRGMDLDEAMEFVMEKHHCEPYIDAIQFAEWE